MHCERVALEQDYREVAERLTLATYHKYRKGPVLPLASTLPAPASSEIMVCDIIERQVMDICQSDAADDG